MKKKAVDHKELLEPGMIYHVYNRAVGNERPFPHSSHYDFFMDRYRHFIAPMVDLYCFCLMPNHFHFLLRIKERPELKKFREEVLRKRMEKLAKSTSSKLTSSKSTSSKLTLDEAIQFINRQFMSFFSSYTQSFNKQQNRKGNLFMKPYCRIKVVDQNQLVNTAIYIHMNPVDARLCDDPADWKQSSLADLLNGVENTVAAREVIDWFGDHDNFRYCHYLEREAV